MPLFEKPSNSRHEAVHLLLYILLKSNIQQVSYMLTAMNWPSRRAPVHVKTTNHEVDLNIEGERFFRCFGDVCV